MTKTCRLCGETKPITDYYPEKRNRDGRVNRCKECVKRQTREWRETNRQRENEVARPTRRIRRLRTLYGITPEQHAEMLEEQERRCRVCRREVSLVVDHDHVSGAVRGLLCTNCNVTLGHVRDDPALLRALADYLERPLFTTSTS